MTLRTPTLLFLAAAATAQEPQLDAKKLFDPNHLVDVRIEMAQADWDKLRHQTRLFVASLQKEPPKKPFTYFKANVVIDGVRIENVGVRKKGLIGSLDTVRPSLKIKFGEFQEQSPAKGLDRLTLNNNKQDRSQVSQYLAYKLFRESGNPACRCNHARVTVNGTPLGIYSNVESIKKPMLEHVFGDSTGALFEGTVADFFLDWHQKFAEKNKQADNESMIPISKLCAEKELDVAKLEEHLDVDAFLRFWATESLIGFWDGYSQNQNNFFVYRKPQNGKLYFMPWGIDSAFVASMPMPPYLIKHKAAHSQAMLCNKLLRIESVRERYRKIQENVIAKVWNEDALYKEIDRVSELVKDHVHTLQGGAEGQAKAARLMKRFVKSRRRVLARELKRWPPKLRDGPRAPMYFEPVGTATGSFDTTYTVSSAKRPFDNGKASVELIMNGEKVELSRVGISAERSNWPTIDGGPKPAALLFHCRRKKDDLTLILAMSVAIDDFRPSGENSVPVMGALIKGMLGFLNPNAMTMVSGTAKIEAAEMRRGAPVKGTFTIELSKMKGGKPIKLDR